MLGITISDTIADGILAFDLIDILAVLGAEAIAAQWQISGVECFGEAAEQLHQYSDAELALSGEELLNLAAKVTQVIEGTFAGYRLGDSSPWIIIDAVDGSAYDIQTSEEQILHQLRQKFRAVSDLVEYTAASI